MIEQNISNWSEIDQEIRGLLKERMEEVQNLLTEKMDLLKGVAKTLLEKETINEEEFQKIVTQFN